MIEKEMEINKDFDIKEARERTRRRVSEQAKLGKGIYNTGIGPILAPHPPAKVD